MARTKFTTPDVRAMVRDLRTKILGLKVVNIYDLDNRTYTFKLAVAGGDKVTLLLESGVRFHTTAYARERGAAGEMPNVFAMKLRKHLRGKSLEDVRQLGTDRVVIFRFGQGDGAINLILELYSSGNIILTDHTFLILVLLRTHEYAERSGAAGGEGGGEGGGATVATAKGVDGGDGPGAIVNVGQVYPMALATNVLASTSSSCNSGSSTTVDDNTCGQNEERATRKNDMATASALTGETVLAALHERVAHEAAQETSSVLYHQPQPAKKGKTKRRGQGKQRGGGASRVNLKMALMTSKTLGMAGYGPSLVEHAILCAGLQPLQKIVQPTSVSPPPPLSSLSALTKENQSEEVYKCEVGGAQGEATAVAEVAATTLAVSLEQANRLAESLQGLEGVVKALDLPGQQGYILCKKEEACRAEAEAGKPEEGQGEGKKETRVLYDEFLPHVLHQHQQEGMVAKELRTFPSFDAAVDEFFVKVEEQKMRQAATAQEEAVKSKPIRIQQENKARLQELEASGARLLNAARLIEIHSEAVDKALLVLRSAVATGAEWTTLEEYIKTEQAAGNALAQMIVGAKWNENKVTMALEDHYHESDDDGEEEDHNEQEEEGQTQQKKKQLPQKKKKVMHVDIDMALSAHANSRALHEAKKKATDKASKTVLGMEKALRAAERQAAVTLSKQQTKRSLSSIRKPHWFEKFNWFITSDNYLVVSGRDAQQNEVLVKRYLHEGDAYVHADVHGAATCIVRNKGRKASVDPSSTGAAENSSGGGGKYAAISPIALHEAGCACVCRSAAWRAKMVTSAWWVHGTQVSKTAPTGEYLKTGSFNIRGKKHFLAPHALEMGLGILFKMDEESLARHVNERRERVEGEDGELVFEGEEGGEGPAGGEEEEKRRRSQALRHKRTKAALVQQPVEEVGVAAEEEEEEKEEVEEDDDEGWAVAEVQAAPEPQETTGEEAEKEEAEEDEDVDGVVEAKEDKTPHISRPAASRVGDEKGGKKGEDTDTEAGASGGGRLSAKERRLMKKGMTLEEIRARERQVQVERASIQQQQQAREDERGDEKERDEDEEEVEEGARRGLQRLGREDGVKKEENDGGNNKRGKKGKMKKMKKRYAEQDDEDRQLALQALGVVKPLASKGKDKKGNKKGSWSGADPKMRKDGMDSKEVGTKLAEELAQMDDAAWKEAWEGLPAWAQRMMEGWVAAKLLRFLQDLGAMELRALISLPTELQQRAALEAFYTAVMAGVGGAAGRKVRNKSAVLGREIQKQVVTGGLTSEAPPTANITSTHETAAAAEGGIEGKPANGEVKAAFPTSRRAAAKAEEEGMVTLPQEVGMLSGGAGEDAMIVEEEQRELRRLTGKPHPDDMLLFAVPVCAPYAALSPAYYKYRVKLTPGPQKKGKAAHQALEVFVRDREATPREVELLKAIPDNDLIASIMGDVKVSKPGIQATLLKAKKVKAKAAKTKSRGLRER